MYTTANLTTTVSAVEQAESATGFPESRRDRLLRTAERIVAGLAPPPEEESAEYWQAASDAEIAVFAYMATTDENIISSESLSGISTSYRSYQEAVRPIVSDAMGRYYGAGSNKAYISAFPY